MTWHVRRHGDCRDIAVYRNRSSAAWHADALNRLLGGRFVVVTEYHGQVPF